MAGYLVLADDEPGITSELGPLLERSGFAVGVAQDGVEALRLVRDRQPDLLILDIKMPGLDGRAVLRQLRTERNWTPVIMLTQFSTDVKDALDEGADDYLSKPFDSGELVARIKAVLRRTQPNVPTLATANRLMADQLQLDRQTRRVTFAGRPLALSPRGTNLLEYLMPRHGHVVPRDQLIEDVWGEGLDIGPRAVDVRIAEIREVLRDDPRRPHYVETYRQLGYRFIPSVQAG